MSLSKDVEITDVTADSRSVKKGSLFCAVSGKNGNGEDYIADAVKNGASAVLTEKRSEVWEYDIPHITAENARLALSVIAARLYGGKGADAPSLIAVTGTNGKTTVTHMIAHLLSSLGFKCFVIGTLGCGMWGSLSDADGMTTPPPERFYKLIGEARFCGADYVIFEASSHGIAQERISGIPFCGCDAGTAVFTNLSPEHMDYHADMEDYFSVKRRLFLDFGFISHIINVGGEYGRRLLADAGGVAVGRDPFIRAENIKMSGVGTSFELIMPDGIFSVHTPAIGAYTAENIITAIAAAGSLGIETDTAVGTFSSFYGVCGRMERVCDKPTVFIDFAHTPAALSAVLKTARELFGKRRLITLFGCGGDRDRTKRPVMGRIAAEGSDLTVITSDNSRTEDRMRIIREILSGVPYGAEYTVIPDRKEAIEFALGYAGADDIILLLGKGHENYDDRDGVKHLFDERKIVKDIIKNDHF